MTRRALADGDTAARLRSRGAAALASSLAVVLGAGWLPGAGPAGASGCPNPTTERVSVASDGTQGQSDGTGFGFVNAVQASISGDGRFVAFESLYPNLVPDKTTPPTIRDLYVHDRWTRTTERVSVSSEGVEGNGRSWAPAISGDGRYVAFHSDASNLVPGDSNQAQDIFVHDRVTRVTERVSVASDGTQANGGSFRPAISADGRFAVFGSWASNLVPGDTNGAWDTFVHDRETGTTTRVSVASDGSQSDGEATGPGSNVPGRPSISGDGRFVAFESRATNLVPGDTNGTWDVFVHDRATGATERVSISSSGMQGSNESRWPTINADGRFVTFTSRASNLVPGDTNGTVDVFVHDRETGATERVSVASDGTQGDSGSSVSVISGDGRVVAFASSASNLVPGIDPNPIDVFTHDRLTGVTELASRAWDGAKGNRGSQRAAISADGLFVAFDSASSNLVPNDTNNAADVFVRDRFGLCAGPLAYTGPTSAVRGTETILSATLTGEGGAPIVGEAVRFTVGETVAEATTDAAGLAEATLVVEETYGLHALRVAYLGSETEPPVEISGVFQVIWEHVFVDGAAELRVNTLTSEIQFRAPGDVSEVKSAPGMAAGSVPTGDTVIVIAYRDDDLAVAGQFVPEQAAFTAIVRTSSDTYLMTRTP